MIRSIGTALTQNSWTKVLSGRATRKWLYLDNGRGSSEVYLHFGATPWSLKFDGTGDSVACNGVATNATLLHAATGSISVRFKVLDDANVKTLVSISDTDADEYVALALDGSEILTATLRTAAEVKWTLACASALTVDKWYTAKLVHNGTAPTLYVDGDRPEQWFSVAEDKTAWIPDLSGLDKARVGSNYFSSSEQNLFLGQISDVKVYAGLESDGAARTLIVHFLFDEGTGTSLTDASGKGNTGTVDGTGLWAGKDSQVAGAASYTNLMRLGTGFNWDAQFIPTEDIWGYTAGAGVVVNGTEGF
jgi:hypothetical protein